jgi:hypothetical protein
MVTVYCHWKQSECTKDEPFDCINCSIRNDGLKAMHRGDLY